MVQKAVALIYTVRRKQSILIVRCFKYQFMNIFIVVKFILFVLLFQFLAYGGYSGVMFIIFLVVTMVTLYTKQRETDEKQNKT